jgi:hypothetical protein
LLVGLANSSYAEVDYFDMKGLFVFEKHILHFQVSVDYALGMTVGNRANYLLKNVPSLDFIESSSFFDER